jgi:hypothetical protein
MVSHGTLAHAVISADGHVDLPLLPPDLFKPRVTAAMRDRVPHVVEVDGVAQWVSGDGQPLARVGGTAHTGSP